MFCMQCGAQVVPGQVFCSKCGQRVSAADPAVTAPPAPVQTPAGSASPSTQTSPSTEFSASSRLAKHLGLLGALWIIVSAFRLIPGLAMMAFGSMATSRLGNMRFPFMLMPMPEHFRSFALPLIGAFGVLLSAYALAGVIAGWGLIAHCAWARTLAIVLGCISLLHFPFGTALGVYTLWVLVSSGAAGEYQHLAQAR